MKVFLPIVFSIFSFFQTNAQPDPGVLKSFGSLSLIAVYNTYYLLGTTYDGLIKETYINEHVIEIADRQLAMMEEALTALKENKPDNPNGFSEGNFEMVQNMIHCFETMRQETLALKQYARFETEDNSDAFLDLSKKTWKTIRILTEK